MGYIYCLGGFIEPSKSLGGKYEPSEKFRGQKQTLFFNIYRFESLPKELVISPLKWLLSNSNLPSPEAFPSEVGIWP
jgi:hypothetical protein